MLERALITKPLRVDLGKDFEQVLIQSGLTTGPYSDFKGARPRKDDVAILDYILRPHLPIGQCTGVSATSSQLSNFQHWQHRLSF